MSGVHFTDGFDRPDTIALGLDAPRLVTVVVGALCAYVVMQAPLPMALRVPIAALAVGVSALLGWGRCAGRPLLSWAWLALRFALSPRAGGVPAPAAVAEPPPAPADPSPPVWEPWLEMEDASPSSAHTVDMTRPAPVVVMMDAADGDAQPSRVIDLPEDSEDHAPARSPAEVLHLPLASHPATTATPDTSTPDDTPPPPVFVGAPRRVTFFSLKGGTGRTTLATELACILAARGRHRTHDGVVRPLNVALLDLDLHSATVAVHLGIAHPTLSDYLARGADPSHLDGCMVRHRSGARVLLGPPKPVASGAIALEPARVAEIVHRLERDGTHFVIIDIGADLGAVATWVLTAAHDVFVVIAPTAGGVQDAYRTTETLRRLGLGHKLRYVVNRAHGTPDLTEVMGDLGGSIAAVVPDDAAVQEAENNHRSVALDGAGPAASALHDLATLMYPALSNATRRPRMGWLPWRRSVG